jgi:thiopeptide-type bacteriocin biosynthesis protein
LRHRGLVGELTLNTYRPETARYGAGPAMDAAEELFAADSTAALAQIGSPTAGREVHLQALTAASMVDLAAAMTGGWATATQWFLDRRPTQTGRPLVREHLRQAVQLADPSSDHAFLRDMPGGELVVGTWRERRRAVAAYLARLRETPSAPPPETVLVSLLHLHHIRALGIDAESEQQIERLARAVALAWASRRTHATGAPQ